MRTLKPVIYYPSREDSFLLWYLTDLHLGAKACNEKLLKRHIQQIADDPNARWIGGGDFIDAVCQVGDKRYHPETIADWCLGETDIMGAQVDYFLSLTKPIADKCIGLGSGNHEDVSMRFYARNIYHELVKGVAANAHVEPDTLEYGVQGFVLPTFRRGVEKSRGNAWQMVIWCHHGWGGGRLPGGHALTLGRVLSDTYCDLALMGHRHVLQVLSKQQVIPGKRGDVVTRESWGVFMPSYLGQYLPLSRNGKAVDTYPEKMALPPQSLGAFPIEIYPMERRFKLLISSTPSDVIMKAG